MNTTTNITHSCYCLHYHYNNKIYFRPNICLCPDLDVVTKVATAKFMYLLKVTRATLLGIFVVKQERGGNSFEIVPSSFPSQQWLHIKRRIDSF